MTTYGIYAVPARAKFVQDFFNGAVTLAVGTYTVAQLKTSYSASDFRFSFNHAQVDIGANLYMERAFAFGHATFSLTDDTQFIVGSGGTLSMSNVRVMPEPDNFDFESTGLAQYLNDYYLQPTIDPSEIGRVVNIVYTGTVSATTYSAQSFATDVGRISTWDTSSGAAAVFIGANIADFVELLRQDGAFENVRDGRDIIYDGQGENHLEIRSSKPGIFIGGDGNDLIEGGALSDIAYGGADNDTFIASAGNDEIWGGDEEGQAAYSDLDTANYSAMGHKIDIMVAGSGNQATIAVSKGPARGTDSLHSIENIVATSGRDVFTFSGAFNSGYTLTIDALGGQSQDDILNFAGMGSGFSYVPNGSNYLLTSLAGNGHAGGGHITLLNFHTQIVGSAYDDIITDEAEGHKAINGGEGDDVITVGDEAGDAKIQGGDGSDILTGGDGNDRIVGDNGGTNETNVMSGGDGADYIYSQSYLDELDGGDGDDYLEATNGNVNNTMIRGGAGNDYIATNGGLIFFGAGDGHDAVHHDLTDGNIPINIFLEGLGVGDITLIWDVTLDGLGSYWGIGDIALVINSTGASIFIAQVGGQAQTDENTGEHMGQFDFGYSFELDPEWAWGDVTLEIGSVSGYDHALADYQAATAGDPQDNEGTSGDDDMAGSGGDDAIDGGDGDDNFQGSGGNDTIEGGDGDDTLNLFGARSGFTITRDVSGVVTVEDQTSLEGTLTLIGVEKIYFATDNDEYLMGDLFGFEGTSGADAITGTHHDNEISGLAGADDLSGAGGNDTIDGGDGDDELFGGDGDDTLLGGNGADKLTGGAGYEMLDGGDGVDVANYVGASADFRIYRDLYGGVVVEDLTEAEGGDYLNNIESLHFAGDDLTINVDDIPLGTAGDDNLLGSARNDMFWGQDGNDSLDGLGGDDEMNGGLGDDLFHLGGGNDWAVDDGGDDAYFYALGDGDDNVWDGAGADYLEFAAGIDSGDVIVTADEEDGYILTFDGSAGSVHLWSAALEDYAIEEVRFDDETVWSAQDLYDFAFGQLAMSAFGGDEAPLGRGGIDLFTLNNQIESTMNCQIA
jgi:Ca2+-binding RTX toxin-like protein